MGIPIWCEAGVGVEGWYCTRMFCSMAACGDANPLSGGKGKNRVHLFLFSHMDLRSFLETILPA
jgi:hypothetical protein